MMKLRTCIIPAFATILVLSACGQQKNSNVSDGNMADNAAAQNVEDTPDKDSKISLTMPGLDAELILSKSKANAQDITIGGLDVYPGSSVQSINVIGSDSGDGAKKNIVRVVLSASADMATVNNWFAGKMKAGQFTYTQTPNNLSGLTREGQAFQVDFTSKGTGTTIITYSVAS